MLLSDRVRPAATHMDPFPPVADRPHAEAVTPVATVFHDFATPVAVGEDHPDEGEAARAAAYAEGVAAGRAEAEQEIMMSAGALVAATEEVLRFRSSLTERYQQELLELALGIARKVVQRELADSPERWLGMIREAVQQALDQERILIRAGSVLHRFLVERMSDLRDLLDGVQELDLAADETLADNGCVIESRSGDLDLSVDSQIGAIRAALTRPE